MARVGSKHADIAFPGHSLPRRPSAISYYSGSRSRLRARVQPAMLQLFLDPPQHFVCTAAQTWRYEPHPGAAVLSLSQHILLHLSLRSTLHTTPDRGSRATARTHRRALPPRSADTATGVLEHVAEGLLNSCDATCTSAATTDDEPEFDAEEEAEEDGCSAGAASVEPSGSCSVTSEDEPLLDNSNYRKIRDLNRCARGGG